MNRQHNQLPQVAFSILLALTLRPRHGYEIIKQVEEDSSGKIRLGAGALYTSIKQLHEKRLIEEITTQEDTRRRYYQLTDQGRTVLGSELEYYKNSLELARKRQVLLVRRLYV
jgi:DNA-binding PadR family transcriptional regulator